MAGRQTHEGAETPEQEPEAPRLKRPIEYSDDFRGRMAGLTGVGFEFLAAIGVCALAGWGLDKWLKVGPWGLLGGIGLGLVVGMARFIRDGLAANRRATDTTRDEMRFK
jgi:F0F1-type ATP synthase assembly protein I